MAQRPKTDKTGNRIFERKIKRGRAIMLLEQVWPRLWLPIGILMLFFLVSILGLWSHLPVFAHILLLGLFALGLVASFIPVFRLSAPDRPTTVRWLEKRSGLAHRPASTLDDHLPDTKNPQVTSLWKAHKKRAQNHVEAMKTGLPHPQTARLDPYALRVPLILAFAAIIGLRADQILPGLSEAFAFSKSATVNDLRVDAWVTPPAYTGTPPVVLVDGAKTLQQQTNTKDDKKLIKLPEMSELVVRISGVNAQNTRLEIQAVETPKGSKISQKTSGSKIKVRQEGHVRDLRLKLAHTVKAKLLQNGKQVSLWHFVIAPDHPPAITFTKKPEASPRGSLRTSYRIADDFGVVEATAQLSKTMQRKDRFGHEVAVALPLSSPAADNLTLPLGTAISFPLLLPSKDPKRGSASTYKDLTAHPWAGLRVEMILTATDEAGKTGKSLASNFKLPERKFTKPLARILIRQRRRLVEKPFLHRKIARELHLITNVPLSRTQKAVSDKRVYLALRSAYWRLLGARTRKTIRSVVDQLWDIALTIEDGNLSTAERQLRSAQDRLMDALSKNASEKEISKLMKELRQALAKFLQAMAQNQKSQPKKADQPHMPGNQRVMTPRQIDKMLRQIENMAKTGAKNAAKQTLSQLREMLENLNRGRSQPSKKAQQQSKQLDELGKMIMRQRSLLDQTHRQNQQQQGNQKKKQGQPQKTQQGPRGDPRDAMARWLQRYDRLQRQRQQQRQGRNDGSPKGQSAGQKQGKGRGQGAGQGRQGRSGEGRGNEGAGTKKQRAAAKKLSRQQGQLLDDFNGLMDEMGQTGSPIPQDLMKAGSKMGQAEKSLGVPQLNSAGRQQGKALNHMRKGARKLYEQMRQASAGRGRQPGQKNTDPLGRAQRTSGPDQGENVKVPDEIDRQRARDILEELRRRLGQNTRPADELDYLERLIEQF